MKKTLQLVGKTIGMLSGTGACIAWLYVMWVPSLALPLTGIAFAVAMLMALIAIMAVIASFHEHGVVLIIMFCFSFFPVGFFLLGLPDWVQVIGVLNLGYLFAGLIAWRTQPAIEKPEPS